MKIRKANKKDKKDFVKLQKQAFPNLNSKKQEKYFEKKEKLKLILVLEDKDNYIGHICFGNHKLNPPFTDGIFIEEFAVKKEFRKNGYGKKLMKELERYCKINKIKIIYLSTGDFKNNILIKYYKKLGYAVVGNLKEINPFSEYKHGQIFMAKILK